MVVLAAAAARFMASSMAGTRWASCSKERCSRPCHGHGRTRTTDSVAYEVLRRIEREAAAAPGKPILVRAAPEVVKWLEAHDEEVRPGLARRGAARVQFEARSEFAREGFDVGTLP
ncbi:MAG TPA: hypothetical protein VMU22_04115 [Rhizomicrobium sp.]|nr:hypothetical protein [Rhizomicrobium sp.]